MAQQSQISLQVKSNSRINECCFVMLIILRLFSLTFTSTHTNCLIQLLKSVSIKPFVSTEAAHFTAAFLTVKLFFRKSLFYSTACRFDQSSSLVSGRRIIQRSKPLSTTSFTASDQSDRSHQQDSTTTLPARRILLESATSTTLNPKATC